MPGAQPQRAPFLFSHPHKTPAGLLLIHGLAASPWEVVEAGRLAFENGLNVYGVRLAGHGTTLDDLDRTNFGDWIQSGTEGLDLLNYFTDKIILLGLSLGGLVALRLAENKKGTAVISLSAPLYLKTSLKLFISLFKNFKKYQYRPLLPYLNDYYYPSHSFHALREMEKLAEEVIRDLKNITQPILIMQSEMDVRVSPRSACTLYGEVRSKEKEMVIFKKREKVPHVMTTRENPLLEKVLYRVMQFVKDQSRGVVSG